MSIKGANVLSIPTLSSARLIGMREMAMTFEESLDHAIAMLQRRGRLNYGALKRQFQRDDAALELASHAVITHHA